jgi:peptidoglycan/xylan/chitin deacetylase (PgdA/CDA1 family)
VSRSWIGSLRGLAAQRAVILGYHGVADCRRRDDPFLLTISPPRFRGLLEAMLKAGFRFVTVAQLAVVANGGSPPPGMAAVSFDDGLRNNLSVAAPILRDLGLPASVYIPTDWLGGSHPWIQGPEGAIVTAAELVQLAAAGWEIGAHSVSHPDMSALDYPACVAEVGRSCEILSDLVGQPTQSFAYPFGLYGEAAMAAVRDAGLVAGLTTGSGRWSPFEMTRAMVGSIDPRPVVLLKLNDRYEPLLRNPPLHVARLGSRRLRDKLIRGRHGRASP